MSAQTFVRSSRTVSMRCALLAGTSLAALLMAGTSINARSLNGGSDGVVSAPNIASDTASQAAQQAAIAARQAQGALSRAARALQDMQAVQAAARAAAAAAQVSATAPVAVPNGIGAGGLQVAPGGTWSGANGPTQSVDANGQTQVGIRQTTQQAILDWRSFNVGARTTLTFDQQGNANWVALNRVSGTIAPSQILGNIKADGQVYVINQSGIIFGGNSQVNVGSLIASSADITNEQFRTNGIYSTQTNGIYTPSFKAAGGKVVVERGASIDTRAPSSVTSGGGFVLMIGSQVENAGSISTPKGQALLAAGDDFILRRGFGTEATVSTTRGIEISPVIAAGSSNGAVSNHGLILSQQGDITLAGRTILQNGALISTTSVNTRGTIHLSNSASDTAGSITLASGSLTAVLPELDSKETALNSQRSALIAASAIANGSRAAIATGAFDNLSLLADRQDQSRVEIVTGGTVNFKGGSTTAAQGGQIAVSAGKRIFTEDGALLDASGVRNVALAMASNNIKINIQGNELRDSPQNRDSDVLKNNDVWIDVRSLTLVPAGTGGYAGDRYYTAGGLLEVGGYLGTTAHTIGEWSAIGGTITLSAPEVMAQRGAVFDISGGSLDYAAGWIRSTNLIGSDGRRYSVDKAPGDMNFAGFAGSFSRTHNIQGRVDDRLTEVWTSVLDRGRNSSSWEEGYSVGRDAGRLILSTPTAIFEANIVADTVTGTRQTVKRASGISDGYAITQTTVAQNGTLALGNYNANGRADFYSSDVRISTIADITDGLSSAAAVALPTGRANTVWFDAGHLNAQKLGGLDIGTRGAITIDAPLVLADGGNVTLVAPVIDIKADITARAGIVNTTNVFTPANSNSIVTLNLNGSSQVTLRDSATIDVRGVWSNLQLDMMNRDGVARRDGGSISLASTGSVVLEQGSAIDVSSGAALESGGKMQGGRGGNVTLTANLNSISATGRLDIGGAIRGYGVTGGGTLAIQAGRVQIGATGQVPAVGTLVLGEDFFNKGFGNYSVTGNQGLTVVAGAKVDVSMPVYALGDRAQTAVTGSDPAAALDLWTPPLYLPNGKRDQLVQRGGASLSLNAGSAEATLSDLAVVQLNVERDAVISVDPGQAIRLSSVGQLTVDGTLNAWGGSIDIGQTALTDTNAELTRGVGHGRSIWIGDHAVLDVAARAAMSANSSDASYGTVANGGSITIGSAINLATGEASSAPDLFVVVRSGARLDASGTQATLDLAGRGVVNVASNGGAITLTSNNGLYLDGSFVANAGGAGAAGGSLSVALEAPAYLAATSNNQVLAPREIILSQSAVASGIAGTPAAAAAGLVYGYGRLAADRLMAGGFDNLTLLSHGLISFDNNVSLAMRQSLQLYSMGLVLAETSAANARVDLSASHVKLSGVAERGRDGRIVPAFRLGGVSARESDAHFSVTSNLLDIQKEVRFNISGTIAQLPSGTLKIDRRGFADVTLASTGDLRFVGLSRLETSADLTLAAAQIYPGTGAGASVHAGWRGGNAAIAYDPRYSLTVRGTGDVPQTPYSVFGALSLMSHTINQGGVIRAPLGTISMGFLGGTLGNTAAVNLLPGSVTSTSALGLVMPYGGTVDGVVWKYAGVQTVLQGVVSDQRGVNLKSTTVNVASGAVIDLRGGGELTGAGFSSGRGGSVDILLHALVDAGPAYSAYSSSGNQVYAIVPGYASGYAPVAGDAGAGNPAIGRQITLDGSTPGLPAGTYTLMPSTYALLPGAFRVEISAANFRGVAPAVSLSNGSFLASGRLGVADTGISESLARQVILTPGDTVRTHSTYNEMSYVDYVRADAVRLGVPRAMLPLDGKNLSFELAPGAGSNALRFDGSVDFSAAPGGFAGSAVFYAAGTGKIEVLAGGQAPTAGFDGVSLYADTVKRLGARRLIIGAPALVTYGQAGNYFTFSQTSGSDSIFLRQGAILSAAEVFLVTGRTAGSIVIEAGAGINTIGMGKTPFDSRDGFIFTPGRVDSTTANSMVVVSNGWIDVLPVNSSLEGAGSILIGACGAGDCSMPTTLYSEGTIAFATTNRFELGDNVRYGTRNLSLTVGAINVGNSATLATAAAANVLPSGLTLNQQVLDRLLRGDTSTGAPALENLLLTARDAINFFGGVTLDTYDATTGKSRLQQLVLGTPAIYGYGGAGDVATIRTESLIWSGSMTAPGSVVAGGAGTGSGALDIVAERIAFGYGPNTQPSGVTREQRLALGFGSVNLVASDRVTANHKGSLNIYQSQGAYVTGSGYTYSGGNLNITSRMVTGEAGSVNAITAGGAIRVAGAAGTLPQINQLGGELTLNGDSIVIASAVVLPSGKLTLSARGDITLTDAALLDLAGRTIAINDATKYSWGGDVILESRDGNIRQASGAVIDLSAKYNNAGRLRAVAVNATAGIVDLQGVIRGATSGYYDAGGTVVPYRSGGVDIRAQQLGGSGTLSDQFAALNQRLNDGHVFGARGFQLKQGDLTIGDGVRASEVDISVDNGHLTVIGTIDASGAEVGAINLSGSNGLTLAGTAVLDAHGKILRVDSYGKIIDSPNRATVELSSGLGLLTLASGARIDLRHGVNAVIGSGAGQNDGVARGTLELNAPRIGSNGGVGDADAATFGDVAIAAGGAITIQGARSIAVNAVKRYGDADLKDGTVPAASGRPYKTIDQAWLKTRHDDNDLFVDAALARTALMNGKLAGLNTAANRDAFHLRPAVEIATSGDLVVQGDLDLSGYRYNTNNPNFQRTGVYGSGEVGRLTLRAGGDLNIYGSINDGFAPPPVTKDDDGWILRPGNLSFGGDLIVPNAGIVLADGTLFPSGRVLNYDLPIKALTVAAGVRLSAETTLNAAVVLPAFTVLAAPVYAANGTLLYAAGTRLASDVTLPMNTRLGAGFVAPANMQIAAMIWPRDVALPTTVTQNGIKPTVALDGAVAVPMGGLIPSETNIKLPAGTMVASLRPVDGNGNQGRNWAVAEMLAPGSQSWSMRLVGGADITAADTRAVRPRDTAGRLVLADKHYSVFDKHEITVIPGTPAQPGGMWYWNELGGELGYPVGTPVAPIDEGWCAEGACVRVNYVWGALGPDLGFPVGSPVAPDYEGFCGDPTICTAIGTPIPGKDPVTIIGALIDRMPATPAFSVVRTGTGDLDLISGGDLLMTSPYGVYTAGTQSRGVSAQHNQARLTARDGSVLGTAGADYKSVVDSAGNGGLYQAWYPELGGNLLLKAGGNLTGDLWASGSISGTEGNRYTQRGNADPANWLWRQGNVGGTTSGAAWWINFGTYVRGTPGGGGLIDEMPYLVGFTGYGTLGGGDLRVEAGGSAAAKGAGNYANAVGESLFPRSEGLVLAVASTGRAGPGGTVTLTGGGDMDVRIGGSLNSNDILQSTAQSREAQIHALNGLAANLRGHTSIAASSQGGINLQYGPFANLQDLRETRAYDPFTSGQAIAGGGLMLMPGDATFTLSSRGDLVLGGVRDAGMLSSIDIGVIPASAPWFSLWTANTAIDLFSAGGNLTPSTQVGEATSSGTPLGSVGVMAGRFVYPSILRAVAPSGSIYLGASAVSRQNTATNFTLMLTPSPKGELEFLAGDSIYAGGYTVSRSGADPAVMPTVHSPATMANLSSLALPLDQNMFAFGPNTASGLYDLVPAKFYALSGDVVGLQTGSIVRITAAFGSAIGLRDRTFYEGAGAVSIRAGRDIVSSGNYLGQSDTFPGGGDLGAAITGNLLVHNSPNDVSVISAGRDIRHSSFIVAGPGTLEISAGRNLLMEGRASVTSIGAVVVGDTRPGASIAMMAGAGVNGPDYVKLAALYLDPANLAVTGTPLAEQTGKVAKTYESELVVWLKERVGFSGSVEEARAAFAALPPEQQRIFLRQVYFAELRAGGREYNDTASARYGSYLRGRQMIATLFPDHDDQGNPIVRSGDITMFGGAGVHTDFGGDIQMMAPSGKVVIGVDGTTPPATAGIVTQGKGDIQIYSQGSVLLGLSRIMTTFGGNIFAWSASGDINAGRGSKTTVLYTPPKRVYDMYGNVTLSPQAPSSGAGIATLNPIPEVNAGDIDLIAPLGTIDAGEAGIRVSGNVNLAALQIVNAANISVQGTSTGMPTVQAPNISAALSSSNATAGTQQTGLPAQSGGNAQPSVIIVEVLGYGGGDKDTPQQRDEQERRQKRERQSYDANSMFQVVGSGMLSEDEKNKLTDEEKTKMAIR